MAKSENQKQKLLYIIKCLMENTDSSHAITTPELITYLNDKGIKAERKSIYNDIATLNEFGFDIIRSDEHRGGYMIASREFELAEVKLLVDLVQASKFITEKKSRELISKLETLVSKNDAKALQGQVEVIGRNKTINETIYYTVDIIHSAISKNVKFRFQYFEWDVNKQMVPRRNGEFYEVSPWKLTWNDENYYLVAYDEKADDIRHYRVDKMRNVSLSEEPRTGKERFENKSLAEYDKQTFSMFSGEKRTVRLLCENDILGVLVDRFGSDVSMRPEGDSRVMAHMDVQVSSQFFGWLAGLGNKVRVEAPEDVVEEYKKYLDSIRNLYGE